MRTALFMLVMNAFLDGIYNSSPEALEDAPSLVLLSTTGFIPGVTIVFIFSP